MTENFMTENFMTENFMTSLREQPIIARSSKTGEETRDQNIMNGVPQISRFSWGEDVYTQASRSSVLIGCNAQHV